MLYFILMDVSPAPRLRYIAVNLTRGLQYCFLLLLLLLHTRVVAANVARYPVAVSFVMPAIYPPPKTR